MTGKTNAVVSGGSGDGWELVETITPSQPVNNISFTIPNEYADCTDFMIDFSGAVLSATDWIYPSFNATLSGEYTAKRSSFANFSWAVFKSSNTWYSYAFKQVSTTSTPSAIGIRTYTSSVNFTTASVVKLYAKR